jgi:hypothetical protein
VATLSLLLDHPNPELREPGAWAPILLATIINDYHLDKSAFRYRQNRMGCRTSGGTARARKRTGAKS